jgi:hypothetical protein
MGQQIPFEPLDSVATGLIAAAERRGDKAAARYGIGRLRLGDTDLAGRARRLWPRLPLLILFFVFSGSGGRDRDRRLAAIHVDGQ